MNQELEIEFKNALTKEEYSRIFDSEFAILKKSSPMTFQTNYYFDTIQHVLKNQHSILRIRVTDAYNELTFKMPSQGFLLETNYPLSDQEVKVIIDSKQIQLSSILSPAANLPKLNEISKDTTYFLFNQFSTKRYEKQIDHHLIVLDETIFQNGVVDYELEIESRDAKVGRLFFNSFLKKHRILEKPSLPKIARAEKNKDT